MKFFIVKLHGFAHCCAHVAALCLLVAFSPLVSSARQVSKSGAATGHPYIQQMVDAVSADSLMSGVRGLVAVAPRYEFGPGRELAAQWIIDRFNRSGIEVESESFTFASTPFYEISMVNRRWAWIAGKNSSLLRTSDGGQNWAALHQGVPDSVTFRGVCFVDTLTGWAVGSSGVVIRSTDGGAIWQPWSSGIIEDLYDVGFANNQLGIAVGQSGRIIRTIDGGKTWELIPSGVTRLLTKIQIVDTLNIWVSGDGGVILRSTDAGRTWQPQTSGVNVSLNGLSFVNPRLGWAVGSKTILKTTNHGNSWSQVSFPPALLRGLEFNDITFSDSLNGWIACGDGSVMRTTDAGQHWKSVDALAKYGLASLSRIAQAGGRYLIACGPTGDIVTSSDFGVSWDNHSGELPIEFLHTSRNIRFTIPGVLTPQKEVLLLAHYDCVSGSPGADDNASGMSALLEVARIMKDYQFESTVTLLAISAEEDFGAGSTQYATQAMFAQRNIIGVVNADMIAYPVTPDTTRLIVSNFTKWNRLIDSALVYNQRYGIGAKLATIVDSIGMSSDAIFSQVGYDALNIGDATWAELAAGMNPYYHKPTDAVSYVHADLMRKAARLMIATTAELAVVNISPPLSWSWQKPFPQWNNLRSVFALNTNTVITVGDLGTIAKTTDAGRTWSQLNGETITHLRGVWYTSANDGFAVGDNGLILRTSNGGANWSSQTIDPNISFYAVCFVDSKNGTAVGYPSAIYRTTNGGNSWVSQLSGPASTLRAVSFTDPSTGTIVGTSGTILRTTNGGLKWNRQLSGYEETDTVLTGVSFVNSSIGTVVGRSGVVLRTTDGGNTWTVQNSNTAYHLNAVTCTDANIATAAGDVGIIIRTTDGGKTWFTLSDNVTEWFGGISFSSSSTGTAVGSYGTIMRTTDGGASWTLQTQGPRTSLNGVWFTNAMTGTVVGYKGSIFKTTDGGATWVTQNSGVKQTLWGICFADSLLGIAVGEGGTIIRTTNGGATWNPQPSQGGWLSSVASATRNVWAIVGGVYATVYRSSDAGVTWARKGFDPEKPVIEWLRAVSFGTPANGIAVGDTGRIISTSNGGITWDQPVDRFTRTFFYGVSMVDANVATIVGERGTIMRTTDGGVSWKNQPSGTSQNLTSVWFINTVYGIAVGDSGTAVRTSNRGATWTPSFTGSVNNLASVCFNGLNAGSIVGEKGTIIRTIAPEIPVTAVEVRGSSLPQDYSLSQNFPNPFNPSTAISYQLSAVSFVTLRIYDILGREIATLVDEMRSPGVHTVRWDASRFASGVYLYRLESRPASLSDKTRFVETKKMVLVK